MGYTEEEVNFWYWKTFKKQWVNYMSITHTKNISQCNYNDVNMVFANHSEDDEIFPLTVTEIARAQSEDKILKFTLRKTVQMTITLR